MEHLKPRIEQPAGIFKRFVFTDENNHAPLEGRMSCSDVEKIRYLKIEGKLLTGPRKCVLSFLAASRNPKTGQCNPSVGRIASITGFSESTVRAALKDLKELKLIEPEEKFRANGGRLPNQYTLKVLDSYPLRQPEGPPPTAGNPNPDTRTTPTSGAGGKVKGKKIKKREERAGTPASHSRSSVVGWNGSENGGEAPSSPSSEEFIELAISSAVGMSETEATALWRYLEFETEPAWTMRKGKLDLLARDKGGNRPQWHRWIRSDQAKSIARDRAQNAPVPKSRPSTGGDLKNEKPPPEFAAWLDGEGYDATRAAEAWNRLPDMKKEYLQTCEKASTS